MARETRNRLAAVAVMIGCTTIHNVSAQPASVSVVIHNDANLPMTLLNPAELIASSIYGRAQVVLSWVHATERTNTTALAEPKVRIRIVSRTLATRTREREAIGFTPSSKSTSPTIAYILEHRVVEVARRYNVPESVVLGATMAHELGHLLLPSPGHTPTGLMRNPFRQLDFIHVRQERLQLTTTEAAQLQAAVAARTTGRARE